MVENFFFFPMLGGTTIRILCYSKLKATTSFNMKEYPTSYTSLIILTSGIYACGPKRFGETCIFSVLFKDQLEQGILNRTTFNAKREEFRAARRYFCGGSCSLSTSERKKKKAFRLIKAENWGFPL